MKQMRRFFILGVFLIISIGQSWAQCAMCRGSVESTVSAGDTSMASNLNIGILYLFFAPYLLAGLIAYIWYKASRKNVKKAQSISSITG